jgi:hypothetical protein
MRNAHYYTLLAGIVNVMLLWLFSMKHNIVRTRHYAIQTWNLFWKGPCILFLLSHRCHLLIFIPIIFWKMKKISLCWKWNAYKCLNETLVMTDPVISSMQTYVPQWRLQYLSILQRNLVLFHLLYLLKNAHKLSFICIYLHKLNS